MRNRLRVLRAERGWTQADLADRLEVSRQTVSAVETGSCAPSRRGRPARPTQGNEPGPRR